MSDAGDRDRLLREYAPTIKAQAQRLADRLPPTTDVADLMQAGVLGLLDALDHYDPARAATFPIYAKCRILGAMRDEIRRLDPLPRSVRAKIRALEGAYAALEWRTGCAAHDADLAHELGLAPATVEAWLRQVRGVALDPEAAETAVGERLDPTADPEHRMARQQLQTRLAAAIDALPEPEKVVLSLYYYEELTMPEIAMVLGVTTSRVSQRHTQAILRLRARLRLEQEALT